MFRVVKCCSFVSSLIVLLLLSAKASAEERVTNVILVQNSGWMLPFYDDPNSKFKNLVVELSGRLQNYGASDQVIASFNQSNGANVSPLLAYKGAESVRLREAVDAIQLAHKVGKQTYADTDFKEAIVGAINQFSLGKSCLLWIVTNNKNSPNNSPETIKKNEEFYNFLQNSDEIKRIVAFPQKMPVVSKSKGDYTANGLMIYAIAYGQPADAVLQKMLKDNAPFGKQPARLKPLNAEALTFVPISVDNKNVGARLANDRKTLILTFSADSKPETAVLTGKFRNDFYPYDIQSATVGIDTEGFEVDGKTKIAAQLFTDSITVLPAGELSLPIKVLIKVPAIPSAWDPEVIFGNGYKSKGKIRFNLDNQKLTISREFSKSMSDLFPRDPLPDLFVPGESAKKSTTNQMVVINVEYPSLPLFILVIVGLLLLFAIVGSMVLLRREKLFKVSIDGIQKTVAIKPFGRVDINDQSGRKIGFLSRGLGGATPHLDKGVDVSVRVM
jgi:hypothetical protein